MEYFLSSLLTQSNCIPTNRIIASIVGLVEATVFGELCGEFDYWRERGEITEDGYFFSTVENIENKLFIKRKQQEKIMKNLVNSGLISIKKKGCPAKRYVKINQENLSNLLVRKGRFSTDEMSELERTKCTTKDTIYKDTILKNKEKEIYKEKEIFSEPLEEEIKRFIKPSIEEITNYCKKNNYNIDAERFFDYYESKGWLVGKSKMKDWKAAVRTWVRNNFESDKRTSGSFPISSTKSVNFSPKDILGDKPKYPDYMKKPGSERCKDIPDLIKEGLYEEYVKISDLIDEWNKKSDELKIQKRRY